MKERIFLLVIILGFAGFLYIFQNYFNTLWGLVFLCILMLIYSLYLHLASYHKRRKLIKNPIVVNKDYKPFVSIMIPAHNEQAVIKDTILKVLQLDYEKFEVIAIDDRSININL